MLSVWKRSWKEKDPPSPVHTQQNMLDGPSCSASSLDSTAAAHPSDAAPIEFRGLKRLYSELDAPLSVDSSLKKVGFDDMHLADAPPIDAKKVLLEHHKCQNKVMILESEQSTAQILAQVIPAVVEDERLRHNSSVRRHRTVALLVNNIAFTGIHESWLHSVSSSLSVGLMDTGRNIGTDLWSHLLRNDVVITTSELLFSSLDRGEVAMTQFRMLIFTNLSDSSGQVAAPIQQIMRSFYQVTDNLSRPEILGLWLCAESKISPPVPSELEVIMDSRVLHFAADDKASSKCPEEVVLSYEATISGVPALFNELQSLSSSEPTNLFYAKHFDDSQSTLDEVGACAHDLFWRRALKRSDSVDVPAPIRDRIKNWPCALPSLDPALSSFNVTYKFQALVKVLNSFEPYGETFRGIILVERRAVALVIADLLRLLDDPVIMFRPFTITWDDLSVTRTQDILHLFTKGVYNILILPKLLNNVDVPEMSAIISFDSVCLDYGADIGPIRAAHVVHMVQSNQNSSSTNRKGQLRNDLLKPLVIIGGNNRNSTAFIQDPTTGSRIYIKDSVEAVNRIVSVGQINGITIGRVEFTFEEKKASEPSFSCNVALLSFTQLTGPPRTTEAEAKSVACFKLCQHLASVGLLDCRFFPPLKLLPSNSIVLGKQLDPKSVGPSCYTRKEPDFWQNAKDMATVSIYPLIITTNPTDDGSCPHAPFAILTRQPLPDLASFKLFHSGSPAIVSISRGAPLSLTMQHLHDLYLYTLRMCRAVLNKPLECSLSNMVYFFAPLSVTWNQPPPPSSSLPSLANHIHWDLVQLAGSSYKTRLKMSNLEEAIKDMHDAVIQDRTVEFTRRYAAVRVRPDLSPLSKPLDSPREAAFDSVLEFTKARRKSCEELQDINQPLVEVVTIPPVLNHLNPTSCPAPLSKSHAKYLIPELSSKCTISASSLRTGLLLPSIMRRIDELLLVKELNGKLFHHKISDVLLHMSLCTPSCGVEYNYERLELLGDAFLKYMSSTYLFVTRPAHKEGSLHNARQDLISNKSLFQYACRAGIPQYIQSKFFSPKSWAPPFFDPVPTNGDGRHIKHAVVLVEASSQQTQGSTEQPSRRKRKKRRKGGPEERIHWLGDKTVADVTEAILAAGYLTGGQDTALHVAKALGLPFTGIDTWSDFAKKETHAPLYMSLKATSISAVEAIIGYQVKQPQLLSQALTHSSVSGHDSTFTERLEFVGDAILDFMVIRHLYEREQQLTPGGLTLLKGAMVSNSTLAAVCVCSGLHQHFYHTSHPLQINIRSYVAKLEASRAKEYQEAESEGRPPGQFWLEITAPKALSDIVESIMGAVYVGDQFAFEGVESLFETLLKPFFDKHITLKTLSHHPTKILFELFQRQGCRRFKILNDAKEKAASITAQVIVHDIALASAEDRDPTIAARHASFFALDALEGDPGFFGRTCDCRIVQSSTKDMKDDRKKPNRPDVFDSPESETENKGIASGMLAAENLQDSELEEGMIVE